MPEFLPTFALRPLVHGDAPEFSRMLFDSFNAWHRKHKGEDRFRCDPRELGIYFDLYNDLTPGCSVAAFDPVSGRMAGACFYHPRESYVALGIMSVHPDFGGRGVGHLLTESILRYTRENGYRSCRLVGSGGNMDSFSLYNRAGFVPRALYQDMTVNVPPAGVYEFKGRERVRPAVITDTEAMGALEMEVSGIRRTIDYRYAIENPRGLLQATVCESEGGGIDGFLVSCLHPVLNMMGPLVARSEDVALALVAAGLPRFAGSRVLMAVPAEKSHMVLQCYDWGARNVDVHLHQVWGEFREFRGVNMPSFLPETA